MGRRRGVVRRGTRHAVAGNLIGRSRQAGKLVGKNRLVGSA